MLPLVGAPEPAQAVPQVPAPPVVVYNETFENAPDTGNPVLLQNYVSNAGGTYTAAPYWTSAANCNGFILSTTNTQAAGSCGNEAQGYLSLRKLAYALGTVNASPNPSLNSVNAAYTYNSTANNEVEFETVTPVQLPTPSRYLTFSVNAAATNCFSNHPRLQFYLKTGSPAVETALGGVIDPCSDPRGRVLSTGGLTGGSTQPYRGGSFPASASFITTASSVGVVMRNLTGTGAGNDGAFDDIRLLDVTPQLDKSFSTPNVRGISRLTFTVTNTSELASKLGWSATDNLPAGLVVATVPNAASTCTGGTVTAVGGGSTIRVAGDIAAGVAFCTFAVDVQAASTPTLDAPQTYQNCAVNLAPLVGLNPPAACATVTFAAPPRLEIVKSTTATSQSKEGDVVMYSITARNVGGSPMTVAEPASLTDDLSGILDDAVYNADVSATRPNAPTVAGDDLAWSGPLGVGEAVVISYSVTLTLDGDARLSNTATLTTPAVPGGTGTASTDTPIVVAPSLSLAKSVNPNTAGEFTLGRLLTYTFVVTNTGNVDIANPAVEELGFTGAGAPPLISCPPTAELAPGAQLTCSATYTVVQDDIDAGGITNVAQAVGVHDGVGVVSEPADAPVPADPAPAITLEKTASAGLSRTAGTVVTYSFVVTNTGNVTLTAVELTETAFDGAGPSPTISCPAEIEPLGPGEAVTCTAPYTLTQQDVDGATITNAAEVSASAPGGSVVTASDDAAVTIPAAPGISLVKSAPTEPLTLAGQTATYTFVVTNTGNVTLSEIVVTEDEFTGSGTPPVIVCPPDEVDALMPGSSVTCTASYVLTQADIDRGSVTNSATAAGTPPSAPRLTSPPSVAQLSFAASPALMLDKSAAPAVLTSAGQTVTYRFVVTNTGNVTISDPDVTELGFTGTGTLSPLDCDDSPALAPSETLACTASYLATQDDIDAGSDLVNTAVATGVPPSGVLMSSLEDTATVVIDAVAAITLVKAVDRSTVTGPGVGVDYSFTVTNSGAVTVSAVAIFEVAFSGTGASPAAVCPELTLAPGESLVCTAGYTTTDADVRAGRVDNTALATALTASGAIVESAESEASFRLLPAPVLPPAFTGGLADTGIRGLIAGVATSVLTLLVGMTLLVAVRVRRVSR